MRLRPQVRCGLVHGPAGSWIAYQLGSEPPGNTPGFKLLAQGIAALGRVKCQVHQKTKGPRWRVVSGFPGQLRLVEHLVAGAFEELGIDLAGDAGIRIGDLPNWLVCTRTIRWGAGGRVVGDANNDCIVDGTDLIRMDLMIAFMVIRSILSKTLRLCAFA